jgi:hypothetical protein
LATRLSLEFEGKSYQCNCQSVRNLKRTVEYVCKGKDYIANMKNLVDGVFTTRIKLMKDMVAKLGKEEALLLYDEMYPELSAGGSSLSALDRYYTCLEGIKIRAEQKKLRKMSTPFQLSDFKEHPVIQEWTDNGCKPTLILVGRSGCGKTQWVKAFALERDLNLLIINQKEGIKSLNDGYDAIFLDDVSIEGLDENAFLALLEENDKRGPVHIFASNRGVGCYSHPFDWSINNN